MSANRTNLIVNYAFFHAHCTQISCDVHVMFNAIAIVPIRTPAEKMSFFFFFFFFTFYYSFTNYSVALLLDKQEALVAH